MFTRSVIIPSYIDEEKLLYATTNHLGHQLDAHHLMRAQEDMLAVYNQIIALEEEYKALLKTKETNQYHQQLELQNDRISINQSRVAIEDLNGQIAMYTSQAKNVHNQNVEVLEKCRKLALEVEDLRSRNLVLEREGEEELRDQRKLEEEIERETARKVKIEGECVMLEKELQDRLELLKRLQGQIKGLDKEHDELEKVKIVALNDNEALEKQKFEREVSFEKTQIALTESLKQKEEAKLSLENLENQNKVLESQHARLLLKLQDETQRAAEAQIRLKTQLKSYAIAENQLNKTLNVNRALKEENDQLVKRNIQLTQNVQRQIKGIQLCQVENLELKEEINVFLACEDETRKLLNHRPPLEMLINNTTQQIHESGKLIQHLRR